MKVGVRWSGIGLLVVILGLAAAVWWLVVDWLVEWSIEETGTEIVGARVDLDAADLSLFPAGLTLTRLQVTNPSAPMTNAVEVDRIAGTFDLGRALLGQTIFEELAVEGVRFGTERATSGAIDQRRTEALAERAGEQASALAALVAGELPDPGGLADRAAERARAEIDALEAELATARERWNERLSELPSRDTLEAYRGRIDALRERLGAGGAGAVAAAADARKLVEQIRADVSALEEAAKGWKEEQETLRAQVREAGDARAQALERLRAEYGVSPEGLRNLSRLLLGPRAQGWVDQGLAWHARLSPLLDSASAAGAGDADGEDDVMVVEKLRGQSARVRYAETDPLPGFLVRRAAVSVVVKDDTLAGEIRNWTDEQPILGEPTTARFQADRVAGLGPVSLDATFDRVRPGQARDRIDARLAGWPIEGLRLSPSEAVGLSVDGGRLDFGADVVLTGERVDARFDADVRDATLSVGGGEDVVTRALAGALRGVKQLDVSAEVSGPRDDYALSLSSSLDDVLRKAIGGVVEERLQALSGRVQEELAGRLAQPSAALQSSLEELSGLGDRLDARTELGEQVLQDALGLGKGGKLGLPGGLRLP